MSTTVPEPTSTGAAVFGELKDALTEVDPMDERRLRPRYKWTVPLTIWVIDEPERDSAVREIRVETTDISTMGFGFLFKQFIHPGAILRTRLEVLPGKPIVDGIVAHCRLTEDAIHSIGVQFVRSY